MILSYLLTGEEEELPRATSTNTRLGRLQVAIKRDSEESPAQVYSELVANRLAQFLGLAVALGVIARDESSPGLSRFASLWVADHDTGVFDFSEADHAGDSPPAPEGSHNETGLYWKYRALCDKYPIESAQLAVFDLWIGNEDRDLNIKGQIGDYGANIVFALDQGSSLLSCDVTQDTSIKKLERSDHPSFHPMQRLLCALQCGQMVERICALPDWALVSAVVCDCQIGSVLPDRQYQLVDVLDKRRKFLGDLVQRVLLAPK